MMRNSISIVLQVVMETTTRRTNIKSDRRCELWMKFRFQGFQSCTPRVVPQGYGTLLRDIAGLPWLI